MTTVVRAVVGAAVLGAAVLAGPARADDGDRFTRISKPTLERLMKAAGVEAGPERVVKTRKGEEFKVYDVKIGPCRGLVWNQGDMLVFMSDPVRRAGDREVSFEAVNKWNADRLLSRAVVLDDGSGRLHLEMPVLYGVTEEQVEDWFKACRDWHQDFVAFLK